MKYRNKFGFVFLFLIAFAFILYSNEVHAENITYTYTTTSGSVINTSATDVEVNVTLPNTSWNLELRNNDSRFKVLFESINASVAPTLNIYAATLDLDGQNYDGVVGNTTNYDYIVLYGYAFNLTDLAGIPYNVTLNYSGLSPSYAINNPIIYKCEHNFTSGITNTSTCYQLTTSHDSTNDFVGSNATNFSSFFIVEDHCTNSVQDWGESGIDCGGSCAACPITGTGGSTGGGGGGGGGGGSTSEAIVYVTPTVEGANARVYKDTELVIQMPDKDYHFRVTALRTGLVTIKDLSTFLTYDLELGREVKIGLKTFMEKEIGVSMYVSDGFAVLTVRKLEKNKFSYPLLPPRSNDRSTTETQDTETRRETYRPPTSPTAQATVETPSSTELPESPINIWTFVLIFIFIIILVGGVALYRTMLHSDKPPTVTRAGSEDIPKVSTTSGPVPITPTSAKSTSLQQGSTRSTIQSEAITPASDALYHPQTDGTGVAIPIDKQSEVQLKPSQESKQSQGFVEEIHPHHITPAKKLELEKYIFHVLGMGFTKDQVRAAIKQKGWPKDIVDEVMDDVNRKTE